MKIIVTDVHSRKAFDIVNILQRVHGRDLLLFAPPGTKLMLPVIYGQNVHSLRSGSYDDFRADLVSALAE
jgi:hypothetical protein